ncbi:MAG TPA: cell envelope integrity protein TolA [Legionella sp.]|nr:cell envelope integrity protein TolA [Legionella sp.]
MMQSRSYRIAFAFAILMHLSLVILLMSESHHDRPVLTAEARNEPGQSSPQPLTPAQPAQVEPLHAVSVDNQEVMKAVSRLKNERARIALAEQSRQRALTQQMELARQQRVKEQQRLESLKRETAALAIAQQKKRLEEEQHLKALAQQKIQEEKRLTEMKQQQAHLQKQQEEMKKVAELEQKKATELARANAQRALKEKADKATADLIQKQQAAAQQAAVEGANAARIAGEVDKYKALIIGAISQQWILPQNADSSMSSQFRIRLAPNGSVLEVSLTRSSGDPILDRSAQSAIYKASPLPVPNDPTTFNLFRDISLTVRPINARG